MYDLLFPSPKGKHEGIRLLLIAFAFLLFFIFFGGNSNRSHIISCELGPISSLRECVNDSAKPGDSQSWYFSYATGNLTRSYCDKISLIPNEISIDQNYPQPPETLQKMNCSILGKNDQYYFCYGSQRNVTTQKLRIVNLLIANAQCEEAYYFKGVNAMIQGEAPKKMPYRSEPYPGIPSLQDK